MTRVAVTSILIFLLGLFAYLVITALNNQWKGQLFSCLYCSKVCDCLRNYCLHTRCKIAVYKQICDFSKIRMNRKPKQSPLCNDFPLCELFFHVHFYHLLTNSLIMKQNEVVVSCFHFFTQVHMF